MAQIAFEEVGTTWTEGSTLGTLTAGKTYEIQNRSGSPLLVNIAAAEPDDDGGSMVNVGETYTTVYNSDEIYLKGMGGSCFVNINEKEEVPAA